MTYNYFLSGCQYWKEQLSLDEQKCYDELLTYLKMNSNTFVIRTENIKAERLAVIIEAIRRDHPEIIWMQRMIQGYYTTKIDGDKILYTNKKNFFKYVLSKKEINRYKNLVYRKSKIIADEASKLETDVQKIKYVHDTLIKSIKFKKFNDKNLKTAQRYQSMISLYENNEAVCLGFSQAFKYIMEMLGIKCYINFKLDKHHNGHAWNVVYVENKWLNVDVTNDIGYNQEPVYYHFLVSNYILF